MSNNMFLGLKSVDNSRNMAPNSPLNVYLKRKNKRGEWNISAIAEVQFTTLFVIFIVWVYSFALTCTSVNASMISPSRMSS